MMQPMYGQQSIPPPITVSLEHEQLWREFAAHTTEMMLTKQGRKLFPKLAFNVQGLLPQTNYGIRVIIQRADKFKYRYQSDRWRQLCEDEEPKGRMGNVVYHKDGFVQSGKDWMRRPPIDFSHFKMSNDPEMEDKHIVFVQSLHKYTPVVEVTDDRGQVIHWQSLDLASFITVTSYQNPACIRLKNRSNPYAKGQYNKAEATPPSSRKRPSGSPLAALQAAPSFPTPPTNQATPFYNSHFPSTPQNMSSQMPPSFLTPPTPPTPPAGAFPGGFQMQPPYNAYFPMTPNGMPSYQMNTGGFPDMMSMPPYDPNQPPKWDFSNTEIVYGSTMDPFAPMPPHSQAGPSSRPQ